MTKNYVPEIYLKEKHGQVFTASLDVAEKFGKRHDDVLKRTRKLIAESGDFGLRNFAGGSYLDEQNQKRPMFYMTRAGFSILAMGFTGKKALEWKIRYEAAFTKMEKALLSRSEPRWLDERKTGKLSRREETDAVSDFVEYAKGQGSTKANFYYKHFTTATYRALFIIEDHFKVSFRDLLNARQLRKLSVAEDIITDVIRDGMANGLYYKDVFQLAKVRLESYAASVGITPVISPAAMLPMASTAIEARP